MDQNRKEELNRSTAYLLGTISDVEGKRAPISESEREAYLKAREKIREKNTMGK